VHGFADADFDMDIDGNFHESEALFFGKLGYIKREDDAEEEEEEEKKSEENDEANSKEEEKKESETRSSKPVAFLERPAAVRKAYYAQFDNISDGSDDEEKLLDKLLEEDKKVEPAQLMSPEVLT